MDIELMESRRNMTSTKIEDQSMIILFAAEPLDYPTYFLQENNFYYFTGYNQPYGIFILEKQKGKYETILFIERGIPEREVWDGKKPTKEEVRQITGINKVFYLDDFYREISAKLDRVQKCWLNLGRKDLNGSLNRAQKFMQKVLVNHPRIRFDDIINLIRPFRNVKDSWEIKQMRKAIEITGKGIESVMKKAKPGMMEYELEAIFNYEIIRRGLRHFGFKSIIGSGINAAILHYVDNNSEVEPDSLILMDVGAACNNYSADITRTFPVSGNFSPRQRDIYQAVLETQKTLIKMIQPGISLPELNEKTVELITDALLRLKLIDDEKDYKKYYMHSVSHHLGMDTHDVGARDSVLEIGNVITVEPGIYIPEEKIGVRIEDDILVTGMGHEVLSKQIPKEIEEIEAICADR